MHSKQLKSKKSLKSLPLHRMARRTVLAPISLLPSSRADSVLRKMDLNKKLATAGISRAQPSVEPSDLWKHLPLEYAIHFSKDILLARISFERTRKREILTSKGANRPSAGRLPSKSKETTFLKVRMNEYGLLMPRIPQQSANGGPQITQSKKLIEGHSDTLPKSRLYFSAEALSSQWYPPTSTNIGPASPKTLFATNRFRKHLKKTSMVSVNLSRPLQPKQRVISHLPTAPKSGDTYIAQRQLQVNRIRQHWAKTGSKNL